MPTFSRHPNADRIVTRPSHWRVIKRWSLISIVMVHLGLRILQMTGLATVDMGSPQTNPLVMAAIVWSVVGSVLFVLAEYATRTGQLRPQWWFRRPPMEAWAKAKGWLYQRRPGYPIGIPFLGDHRRQRVDSIAQFTLDGAEAMIYEVRYERGTASRVGQQRFATGISIRLSEEIARRLPQVTVSPSSDAWVAGSKDIRDHRFERADLDARFQIDAAAGADRGDSEIALYQLFGPQMLDAMGDTFCSFWQHSGVWLAVWIPGRFADGASLDALLADATWLKGRYDELDSGSRVRRRAA